MVVGECREQTGFEHVDRNNGMFIVYGVDLTKRAQPVVFRATAAQGRAGSWSKLTWFPQCAPVSSRSSSCLNSGFPGNSSRSWLRSCRAPVKFFSRLSAMARRMRA